MAPGRADAGASAQPGVSANDLTDERCVMVFPAMRRLMACRCRWRPLEAGKAEHAARVSDTMRHRADDQVGKFSRGAHGYHRNDQRADCQQHHSALHERLAECPAVRLLGQGIAGCDGCGEKFAYVDILQNPEIRANLPKYANWPTFPQLWVAGELVGGSDIMLEMFEKVSCKP
jgi:hypothetical protein